MNPKLKNLLKDADTYIVLTKEGMAVNASCLDVLTMLSILAEKLIKDGDITKDRLIYAIETCDKEPTDVLEENLNKTLDLIKDLLGDIKKKEEK